MGGGHECFRCHGVRGGAPRKKITGKFIAAAAECAPDTASATPSAVSAPPTAGRHVLASPFAWMSTAGDDARWCTIRGENVQVAVGCSNGDEFKEAFDFALDSDADFVRETTVADFFTKLLASKQFFAMRNAIMNVPIPADE